MAEVFNKKTWADRETEFPNRFVVQTLDSANSINEITRLEGEIYKEGDALDADNFNDLEERIEMAFEDTDKKIDSTRDQLENKLLAETYNIYAVIRTQDDNLRNQLLGMIDDLDRRLKKLEK